MDNEQTNQITRPTRRSQIFDLVVIVITSVIVFVVARAFDILENLVAFTERHEKWELDELIIMAIFIAFALSYYSFRRWREIVSYDQELETQNQSLTEAIAEIKQLRGIIPICSHCKNIRDDDGFWHRVEAYIKQRSDAQFSHGICPECTKILYPEYSDDHQHESHNDN